MKKLKYFPNKKEFIELKDWLLSMAIDNEEAKKISLMVNEQIFIKFNNAFNGGTTKFFEMPELSSETIELVRKEILLSFQDGLDEFNDFESFFSVIDQQNGYEEEWKDQKGILENYYKHVFNILKK